MANLFPDASMVRPSYLIKYDLVQFPGNPTTNKNSRDFMKKPESALFEPIKFKKKIIRASDWLKNC